MVKEFCHICSDRSNMCVHVLNHSELAMLKVHPKCSICGRSLTLRTFKQQLEIESE
jgi:hypothetical protein